MDRSNVTPSLTPPLVEWVIAWKKRRCDSVSTKDWQEEGEKIRGRKREERKEEGERRKNI